MACADYCHFYHEYLSDGFDLPALLDRASDAAYTDLSTKRRAMNL
jgi:hypothetical protein